MPSDTSKTLPQYFHRLFALGPITEKALNDRLDQMIIFLMEDHFLKDQDFVEHIAKNLEPWESDVECSILLIGLLERETLTSQQKIDLPEWILYHKANAEAVIKCLDVEPPDGCRVHSYVHSGSHKNVFRASAGNSSSNIVLKQFINKSQSTDAEFITTLPNLEHPFIVNTYSRVNRVNELFLFEEYIPETLESARQKGEGYTFGNEEAATLIYCIADGIHYLEQHARRVHGDVKPDNIGISEGHFVLMDLGASRDIMRFSINDFSLGSLKTRAPELLNADPKNFGNTEIGKFDIWSLGACAFYAFTGKYPLLKEGEDTPKTRDGRDEFEELLSSRLEEFNDTLEHLEDIPDDFRPILKQILCIDPANRLTAAEVLVQVEENFSNQIRKFSNRTRLNPHEKLEQLYKYIPKKTETAVSISQFKRAAIVAELKGLRDLGGKSQIAWKKRIDDILTRLQT